MLEDRFLSKGFNFNDFHIHDVIRIKSEKDIDINLKQNVYRYFLRCIDLNFTYYDQFEPYFQFANWDSINTMK